MHCFVGAADTSSNFNNTMILIGGVLVDVNGSPNITINRNISASNATLSDEHGDSSQAETD